MKALVGPTDVAATVTTVAPRVALSYSFPKATLAFPFPVMFALLDERGLHRIVKEEFTVTDQPSITVGKRLVDLVLLGDAAAFTLNSLKRDDVSITDTFNRTCVFKRGFSDSVSITELAQIMMGKRFTDSVLVMDSSFIGVSKTIADTIEFSEYPILHLGKRLTDTVGYSDACMKTLSSKRADSFTLADSLMITAIDYCDSTYFAEDYVEEVSLI